MCSSDLSRWAVATRAIATGSVNGVASANIFQYFSKYLLFAKVEPDVIPTRVFEAFQAYLDLYWKMLADATPLTDPVAIARVATAQREYDQYSADRDPAHGLFSSHFGTDWANQFLFEFLFEDAKQLVTA